jgi:NTE family protein
VEWLDALLVDGGMVENVPVRLAQEMGAGYVVAVDVSTPIEKDVVQDMLGVTLRIVDLLFSANNNRFGLEPELLIRPDLEGRSFADYSNVEELIELGRAAAEARIADIPDRYRGRDTGTRMAGHMHDMGDRVVSSVHVAGNEYLSDDALLREFRARPGSHLAFPGVLSDLDHLLSTGLLKRAWLDLGEDGPDAVRLDVTVQEEYQNTLDVGLAYQSDNQAQAMARYERRDLFGNGERLQLGGFASARDLQMQARLHAEAIFGSHIGYQVDLTAHDDKPKYFVNDEFINRALFRRRTFGLASNVPFSLNQLLTLGLRVGTVETTQELGVDLLTGQQAQRLITGRYIWDDLDSLNLPGSGRIFSAQADRSEPALGATYGYWRLETEYHEAFRLGPLVTQVRALYGYSGGDLPDSEKLRLGGPELVPGLAREQLWGDQALAASLQLGFDPVSIGRVYVRAGAGNVWQEVRDIAFNDLRFGIGIGGILATPVGPLTADYAWLDGGGTRFYLAFGWQ